MFPVTSERWRHVQELVERALAIHASARRSWLDRACQDDELLRGEVESFIEAYASAQHFMEQPGGLSLADELEEDGSSLIGQRIGAYRILQEIGQGGMGTVYLAARTDDQYQKRVAIKVIRRGMDTDAIVRRFRRERQILAALEHANIARFFDGGTTDDGRSYLIMEYIEGQPIDTFCDSRGLTIPQRLKLFRTVCDAVQYAHRNLVVHQDIKPTNILVAADGTPKLLDFGIAKLLNPELGFVTLDRTAALRLITPEYSSPEQIRGDLITTAADVYSLGTLLYKLLTGHPPYDSRSRTLNQMLRVVCENDPEAPSAVVLLPQRPPPAAAHADTSTAKQPNADPALHPASLSRQLRGDLDNIVLKALRKEPARRYSSPEQLSEDIYRHLEHLPVSARRGTFFYRAERFLQRHGLAVAVGVLVSILVATTLGIAVWQARVARLDRARADRRFNDVRKLANSYLFEFNDAIENLPGSTPARALLVSRALAYLSDLSREATGDAGLQRELATAYVRIGNVQGQPAFANLGDSRGALDSYSRALSIRQNLVRSDPESAPDRLALGEIYRLKGNLLGATDRRAEAFECVHKALQITQNLSSKLPTDREVAIQVAMAHSALADLEAGMNVNTASANLDSAIQHEQEALRIYSLQLTLAPGDHVLERRTALASMRLGDMMAKLGRKASALGFYNESLDQFERMAQNAPNAASRRNVAHLWYRIGTILIGQSAYSKALAAFQKGLLQSQSLADADPQNAQAQADLAYGYADLGEAEARDGHLAEGLAQMRKGIRIMERIVAVNPNNSWVRSALMQTYVTAGDIAIRSDQPSGNEFFTRAAETARLTLARSPGDTEARTVLDHCTPRINRH